MGNCQAAEAATVVIQHPRKKIERIYWSVSANEIMSSNPGHYVALVTTSPTLKNENGSPMKQLKLLKPDDSLLIGHVYRLISFEDVLKEFAAKKCVKLGKLLKDQGGLGLKGMELKRKDMKPKLNSKSENCSSVEVKQEVNNRLRSSIGGSSSGSSSGISSGYISMGRPHGGGGQWRPALQSISEIGT